MKLKAIALALFLIPAASEAQQRCANVNMPIVYCTSSAPNQACVEWTPPTTNTDGSLISAIQKPLVFRVFWRDSTGLWVPTSLVTQNLFGRLVKQPLGEQCYAV